MQLSAVPGLKWGAGESRRCRYNKLLGRRGGANLQEEANASPDGNTSRPLSNRGNPLACGGGRIEDSPAPR